MGQNLGNGNRSEIEFLYRANSAADYTLNQFNGAVLQSSATNPGYGTVNSYSTMANFYRDLTSFSLGNITPYLGGGFGVTYVDGNWSVPGAGLQYSIDDWAFAWQIMAGATIQLTNQTDFFTEYRYYDTSEVDIVNAAGGIIGDFNYENSSIVAGFRIKR